MRRFALVLSALAVACAAKPYAGPPVVREQALIPERVLPDKACFMLGRPYGTHRVLPPEYRGIRRPD